MRAIQVQRRTRSQQGFTLLELTTAMFVLVVGIFGIVRLFQFGLDRMRTIDESAIASQAVLNELELVRSTPYAILADGTRAFVTVDPALEQMLHLADTKVVIAAAPDGTPGLKQVEVSIRWITEYGRRAERSVTTLVAEALP
ncbi:MAG: prepilin-type N-terminal cleavage/methylation domain-containing protein [Candidatus Hydrogenedentes bacterium]|nr:prepilin-type N-terminal cleavage/methylation domain-containing protein [Candidatus Hydrogenedentota bacterium]